MGFMTGKNLQRAKQINLAKLISAKKGIVMETICPDKYVLKSKDDQYTVFLDDEGNYKFRDIFGEEGDIFDFLQKYYDCTKNRASDIIKESDYFEGIQECTYQYENNNYRSVLNKPKEYSEAVKSMHKNDDNDMTKDELESLIKFLGSE